MKLLLLSLLGLALIATSAVAQKPAEREALPRHNEDGAQQPVEDAEFAVVAV